MTRPAIRSRTALRSSGLPGSGRRVAISAARQAASGLRAGQMWRVEIWPWRTFFSCTESRETCFRGKATSMRRLDSGVMTVSDYPLVVFDQCLPWVVEAVPERIARSETMRHAFTGWYPPSSGR